MATPDQIPTDLTLEIGENLPPEKFLAVARAFFGYVDEVADAIAPGTTPLKWKVIVREGSALIGVQPSAAAPPEFVQNIYAKAAFGIDQLARGHLEESRLTEPALRHLRVLSGLTAGGENRPIPIRIWIKKNPVDLSAEIARVIEDDWRVDYRDYGTIEGRLETIQDNDGRLQLRVRDAALRQIVRCHVPDEMLDDVFSKFRKRVEVSGMIHYRRNGTPISIEVVHIEALADDSDLPTADDVRGILKLDNGGRPDLLG
jgi:hypothetical protein